jgi:hypothetical protein
MGVQVLVNSINSMLGNYGSTIDIRNALTFFQGNDAAGGAIGEGHERG